MMSAFIHQHYLLKVYLVLIDGLVSCDGYSFEPVHMEQCIKASIRENIIPQVSCVTHS